MRYIRIPIFFLILKVLDLNFKGKRFKSNTLGLSNMTILQTVTYRANIAMPTHRKLHVGFQLLDLNLTSSYCKDQLGSCNGVSPHILTLLFFFFAVGVCVFMFSLSWRLSMITVVGLPVIMSVSKLYGEYYEVCQ